MVSGNTNSNGSNLDTPEPQNLPHREFFHKHFLIFFD